MKSLRPNQPHLIIVVGLPGSGKTFFASKFAETFNAPYVSTEVTAKLTGCDDERAKEMTLYQVEQLLKTNHSIIVEGDSNARTDRLVLAKQARDANYKVLTVWVQTDPLTAKNRSVRPSKNKTNRTLSEGEYDKIARKFTAPNAAEQPVVISGKHTYATQVKIVLKKLSAEHEQATRTAVVPERRTSGRIINVQ